MVKRYDPKDERQRLSWRVIGKSVQGASHKKADIPNQDAIDWSPKNEGGLPLVLAVSDGHGSAKCFRSHLGSRFAVVTAINLINEFIEDMSSEVDQSAIKRMAEERMPQEIVRRWQDQVNKNLEQNPFSAEELNSLETKSGSAARQTVEDNPEQAYGATLLSALITDSYILYLQLGDGDILVVEDTGSVGRPVTKDERLIANETTSLCTQDAWLEFRVYFQSLLDQPPALILLSTDGYSNSFPDEENFRKVGPDYLQMIRESGLEAVSKKLETWLTECSRDGSGDDISVGIIKRVEQGDKEWAGEFESSVSRISNHVRDQESKLDEVAMASQKLSKNLEDYRSVLDNCETKINDLAGQTKLIQKHEDLVADHAKRLDDIATLLLAIKEELPLIKKLEDENRRLSTSISRLRLGGVIGFFLTLVCIVSLLVFLGKLSSANNSELRTHETKSTAGEAGEAKASSAGINAESEPMKSNDSNSQQSIRRSKRNRGNDTRAQDRPTR